MQEVLAGDAPASACLWPVHRCLSRKVLPFLGQNCSRDHAEGLTVWKGVVQHSSPLPDCFTSNEVAGFSGV